MRLQHPPGDPDPYKVLPQEHQRPIREFIQHALDFLQKHYGEDIGFHVRAIAIRGGSVIMRDPLGMDVELAILSPDYRTIEEAFREAPKPGYPAAAPNRKDPKYRIDWVQIPLKDLDRMRREKPEDVRRLAKSVWLYAAEDLDLEKLLEPEPASKQA